MVEPFDPTINPPKIQIMKSFIVYIRMLFVLTIINVDHSFFPYAKVWFISIKKE